MEVFIIAAFAIGVAYLLREASGNASSSDAQPAVVVSQDTVSTQVGDAATATTANPSIVGVENINLGKQNMQVWSATTTLGISIGTAISPGFGTMLGGLLGFFGGAHWDAAHPPKDWVDVDWRGFGLPFVKTGSNLDDKGNAIIAVPSQDGNAGAVKIDHNILLQYFGCEEAVLAAFRSGMMTWMPGDNNPITQMLDKVAPWLNNECQAIDIIDRIDRGVELGLHRPDTLAKNIETARALRNFKWRLAHDTNLMDAVALSDWNTYRKLENAYDLVKLVRYCGEWARLIDWRVGDKGVDWQYQMGSGYARDDWNAMKRDAEHDLVNPKVSYKSLPRDVPSLRLGSGYPGAWRIEKLDEKTGRCFFGCWLPSAMPLADDRGIPADPMPANPTCLYGIFDSAAFDHIDNSKKTGIQRLKDGEIAWMPGTNLVNSARVVWYDLCPHLFLAEQSFWFFGNASHRYSKDGSLVRNRRIALPELYPSYESEANQMVALNSIIQNDPNRLSKARAALSAFVTLLASTPDNDKDGVFATFKQTIQNIVNGNAGMVSVVQPIDSYSASNIINGSLTLAR